MSVPTTSNPLAVDSRRRRLSRWALTNAWKLAGLTALVTFVGVFIALTLSLILRPIPSYFFPLLSDVFKYQPEGAILYIVFVATSALFFATTTASILHFRSLQVFSSSSDRCVHPLPLHNHSHNHHNHTHLHHHTPHHAHTSSGAEDADEMDLSEIVPVSPQPVRRRHPPRFATTRTLTLIVLITIISFSTIQFPAMYEPVLKHLTAPNLKRLIANFVFYTIVILWVFAMGFLIWYFLKLQKIPDWPKPSLPSTPAPVTSLEGLAEVAEDIPASTTATITPERHPHHLKHEHQSDDEDELQPINHSHQDTEQQSQQQHQQTQKPHQQQQSNQVRFRFADHFRAFASWLIAILRPVCLTGQAVCLIKIFGLWLALDTFSISNIRIVKLALLATLAFVEYTAAFFFVFFMIILAIDMRAKAPSPDFVYHT